MSVTTNTKPNSHEVSFTNLILDSPSNGERKFYAVLFLLYVVMDFVITYIGLTNGLAAEGNGIHNILIHQYGWIASLGVVLAGYIFTISILYFTRRWCVYAGASLEDDSPLNAVYEYTYPIIAGTLILVGCGIIVNNLIVVGSALGVF